MINLESVNDILEADHQRVTEGKMSILTPEGLRIMNDLKRILSPIDQHVVDDFIRGTVDKIGNRP